MIGWSKGDFAKVERRARNLVKKKRMQQEQQQEQQEQEEHLYSQQPRQQLAQQAQQETTLQRLRKHKSSPQLRISPKQQREAEEGGEGTSVSPPAFTRDDAQLEALFDAWTKRKQRQQLQQQLQQLQQQPQLQKQHGGTVGGMGVATQKIREALRLTIVFIFGCFFWLVLKVGEIFGVLPRETDMTPSTLITPRTREINYQTLEKDTERERERRAALASRGSVSARKMYKADEGARVGEMGMVGLRKGVYLSEESSEEEEFSSEESSDEEEFSRPDTEEEEEEEAQRAKENRESSFPVPTKKGGVIAHDLERGKEHIPRPLSIPGEHTPRYSPSKQPIQPVDIVRAPGSPVMDASDSRKPIPRIPIERIPVHATPSSIATPSAKEVPSKQLRPLATPTTTTTTTTRIISKEELARFPAVTQPTSNVHPFAPTAPPQPAVVADIAAASSPDNTATPSIPPYAQVPDTRSIPLNAPTGEIPQREVSQQNPLLTPEEEIERKCLDELGESQAVAGKKTFRRRMSNLWMDANAALRRRSRRTSGKMKMHVIERNDGSMPLIRKRKPSSAKTKRKKKGLWKKLKGWIDARYT